MTDAMIELSRRAVACKGWRWSPGMLDVSGRRVLCVWPDDLGIKWSHLLDNRVVRDADALPDLTDPATQGCLLALVREAWGNPHIVVERGWDLAWGHERPGPSGYWLTEAEMLVAALESAP
jgi:hypothetical protein